MDKKYQDIHYRDNKSNKDLCVYRQIEIYKISFKESYIEVDFIEINPITVIKTIIIPKIQGHSLIID